VNIARGWIGGVEEVGAEILRLLQRHMTAGAVYNGLIRVIKTAGAVAGHTAEEEAVVMVLAAQELFVVVQLLRNADLVTGGAEFRGAHEGF